MLIVLAICLVGWKIEEEGLSVVYIDVFASTLAVIQVAMSLTWMSYQHPESHLLSGCLSAFFLSHSICMSIIHQLPDDRSATGVMDVAYFFMGVLFVKIYHNLHKRIFYTSSQTFSYIWKSTRVSQLSEKYTIFRLIHANNDDRNLKSEMIFYLQNHFATCKGPTNCFCLHLQKVIEDQTLGDGIFLR